jgi:hypothetical protein
MHIAPSMKPADAYYFINVLPTARRIDWNATKIPMTKRFHYLTPEGQLDHSGPREMRDVYRANPGQLGVVFRRREKADPVIWHELNVDDFYTTDQGYVLIEADLWKELDRRFPDQLTPWEWKTLR